jgi:hypothetical protein
MISINTSFVVDSVGLTPGGSDPDVSVFDNGNFVVVWTEVLGTPVDGIADTDGAVFARVYTADGEEAGEAVQVNTWSPGVQSDASVAATDTGFVVSWQSRQVWGTGLVDTDSFLSEFSIDGTATILAGATTDLSPDNPGAPQPTKSWVVDLGGGEVALVLDGNKVALETGETAAYDGKITGVAKLANGNIVVSGDNGRPFVVVSDGTLGGAPVGIPGLIEPVTFPVIEGPPARNVQVTALTPGTFSPEPGLAGFVVTGFQFKTLSTSVLVADVYTAWGERIGGTAINVPLAVEDAAGGYDVLALPDGTFLLAWTTEDADRTGVVARHVDADGSTIGTDVFVHASATGRQSSPSLDLVDADTVIVVFESRGGPAIDGAVGTVQGVLLDISLDGSVFAPSVLDDVLVGTGAGDAIDGLGGEDRISGRGGDDLLIGGDGADVLNGDGGHDALRGSEGADSLYGGAGHDGLNGGSENDRLFGGDGNDGLQGGVGADRLSGGAGDDVLRGGRGGDVLSGGAGADKFVFGANGGSDVVRDFDATDVLSLNRALWNGDLNRNQVLNRFGEAVGDDYVLTFNGGEKIVLEGVDSLDASSLILV